MKPHYTTKKLDSFGRLTLPKAIREKLNLSEHDKVKIYLENEKLTIEKLDTTQVDCFNNQIVSEPLYEYQGKKISRSSIIDLANMAGLLEE